MLTPGDMGVLGYLRLRTNRGTGYGVGELPAAELGRLLDDPAALLWRYVDRPIKIAHNRLMVEAELQLSGETCRVAYKRYRPRNWWKSLCGVVRRSSARKAWELGRGLIERGIATARPLAVLQPRAGWLFRSSYLATEWIDGAENLHHYAWRLAGQPLPQRLRSAAVCATSLGHLVGRMHARQIAHRDLKGANLLVAERGDRLCTYLVDVDGVRFRRRLGPRRRAADLARLATSVAAHPWVTSTLCRRFLRAYVAEFPPGTIAWKPLWREVAAQSRLAVERKRRRGQDVL